MTATLGSFPVFRAFDDNGAPLVGGFLHSYAAGTLTPLATYTDQGGGTQNTNPVQMDSTGSANVWFGSSAYKLVLKTSTGSTLWTVDNYQPESAAATLRSDLASTASTALGDGLVGVEKTGGIATTDHAFHEGRDFNAVVDFGLSPYATATANASALSIAIAAARTAGKSLYIPGGSTAYQIDTSITVLYDAAKRGVRVYGDSTGNYYADGRNSCIEFTGTTGYLFDIQGDASGSGSPMFIDIEGINFIGNATCYGAISHSRSWSNKIIDCSFNGFSNVSYGVVVVNASGSGSPFAGDLTVSGCRFQSCGRPVLLTGATTGQVNVVWVRNGVFLDCQYGVVSDWGASVVYTRNVVIDSSHFEGITHSEVYSQSTANSWTVMNCYLEQNDISNNEPRIRFLGASNIGIVVRGNTFSKQLQAAGESLVYAINTTGFECMSNASAFGGSVDRFSVDLVTALQARAEVMAYITGTATPYPVRMNNYVVKSGDVNDTWKVDTPTGSGKFVGVSSGDGWPGGTVETLSVEHNKNNAQVRINFKTTITTKSGSGTSFQIGLLPYANAGTDLYFPVQTVNVTGTKPFYGVLANGAILANVYDAAGVALNYQTVISVGSVISANFIYTTQD